MAKLEELNINVVGIYTATTTIVTEPRLSNKLLISKNEKMLLGDGCYDKIMQKRMHIILYYKNKSDENSRWHVGGWIKKTLGNALVDHPIMAGRIRRDENGCLEIVANDSGVRIVEGEIALSLVEFFECKTKNNEVEGKLVSWVDVEINPQFSPLFYVQVKQCH